MVSQRSKQVGGGRRANGLLSEQVMVEQNHADRQQKMASNRAGMYGRVCLGASSRVKNCDLPLNVNRKNANNGLMQRLQCSARWGRWVRLEGAMRWRTWRWRSTCEIGISGKPRCCSTSTATQPCHHATWQASKYKNYCWRKNGAKTTNVSTKTIKSSATLSCKVCILRHHSYFIN